MRVRLSMKDLAVGKTVGTLLSVTAREIVVKLPEEATPSVFSLTAVDGIEVSRGRQRWRRRNVFLGAALGFAVGLGIAFHIADTEPTYAEQKITRALLMAPILGAFAGGLVPGGEIWDDIAIPADAHTSAQRARGLGLAFSISF